MRHGIKSRLTALLLAALFLGGVGGASDLDAFLFHQVGAVVATGVVHVEAAGYAGCHADRCLLALRLASGRNAHTLAVPVRFAGIPLVAVAARPDGAPPRFLPGLHLQSRAPPASRV